MVAVIASLSQPAETESQAIARALKRRDSDFIARLVSQYHYRLLRYLVYLTARREHAEDLVQETWLRVLERAGQYDSRLRFEPWLFSIARNLAIDGLRKHQPESLPEAEIPETSGGTSDGPSPFLAAAKNEDAFRIAAALGQLEPIYREALLLRFQEDLSLEEIGQVAGAPVSTIASRIQRGLAKLRTSLEGETNAE